jgi:DNA (cytosine-5)-methyltransferase 1
LEEYSETWPKAGIVLDGYAMELEILGRRIKEKGCSSWPTPRAQEIDDSNGQVDVGTMSVKRKSGQRFGASLTTVIHYEAKNCPTPTVQEVEHPAVVKMWPTPHSTCSTGPGKQGRQGGENLQTAVWPTPKSRDWKSPHGKAGMERKTPDLNVMTQQGKGQLNPAWVTLLMGFPPGWLDIDGPPGQGHSIPGNRRGLQPG